MSDQPSLPEGLVACLRWLRTIPAFEQPRRPLAIGIQAELQALLPPTVSRRMLRRALALWCGSPAYLRALTAASAMRVDLAGAPVTAVTVEDAAFAAAGLAGRSGAALSRTPEENRARKVSDPPSDPPNGAAKTPKRTQAALATEGRARVAPNPAARSMGRVARAPDGRLILIRETEPAQC